MQPHKMLRSLLFIPADSEKKLGKGDSAGADAVILDLEDSVAPGNKAVARSLAAAFLAERPAGKRTSQLWVRINALDQEEALSDLAAVIAGAPDGIVLPKAAGAGSVQMLSHFLDALEVQAGLPRGAIGILPVATETASAALQLPSYAAPGLSRLRGITWGAEDLSTALGASTSREEGGGWAMTYRVARSMTLLAAHAAHVQAIDTLYADFRDQEGLRCACRSARAEGFTGGNRTCAPRCRGIRRSAKCRRGGIGREDAGYSAFEAGACYFIGNLYMSADRRQLATISSR
jgi:citrate lyase subunit beta/citryl-CoA lyase